MRPGAGPGAGPGAPPPRPPVQSIYGPGGPNRMAAPAPTRRSRLAVVALVLAVLVAPVGFVLGIVARRRIAASSRPTFEATFGTPFDEPRERLTGRAAATAAVVVGLLVTVLGGGLVAALTVGVPTSWLPSDELAATSVQTKIEETVRLPAGSVRCPGPLPATVGATITCSATQNGQPRSFRATVTVAQGRDIRFDVTPG